MLSSKSDFYCNVFCIKDINYMKRHYYSNKIYEAYLEKETLFIYTGEIDENGVHIGIRFSYNKDDNSSKYLLKFSDYFANNQELRKIKLKKLLNEK